MKKLVLIALGILVSYGLKAQNIWDQGGDPTPIYHLTGNVGIGTPNPERLLDIKGTHSTSNFRVWYDDRITQDSRVSTVSIWASEPGISYSAAGIGYNINKSPYYGIFDNVNGASAIRFTHTGSLKFYTLAAGGTEIATSSPDMIILPNGNVGIGTTDPLGSKLFVNGNTRIAGTFTASQLQLSNSNTHLSIYEDSDIPNWALLRSNIGEGIAIIGQPDVVSIAVSRTNSNVGIGTRNIDSRYKLTVNGNTVINGKLITEEVEVKADVWPDFVFHPTYKLNPLEEVEQYIKTNKHLPGVPSEKEVKENGLSLGQSDAVLLQKIEELTLYLIDQNKKTKEQSEKIKVLEETKIEAEKETKAQKEIINELIKRIEKLESKK